MRTLKLFILLLSLSSFASIFAQKSNEIRMEGYISEHDNIELLMKDKKPVRFVQFGIMSRNHESFMEKYGIQVVYQNCVISPFLSKLAQENNKAVARYLTEKYGEIWKEDLGFLPYGI